MRKNIKTIILEALNGIVQMNKELAVLFAGSSSDKDIQAEVISILTDMQETIILIGEEIDKAGVGTEIIPELEDCCELIWKLAQEDMNADRGNDFAQLKTYLQKVKKEIEIIPTKHIVVFLPYKASMWDSMESIWLEAKQDPECECFVIPIPYCDKKANGGVDKVHYELEMFPEYVPVISCNDCDLNQMHPEVIYIHNPYDECNYVTSVAPEYYSYRLKQCTDLLVYVPYYMKGNGPFAESHRWLPSFEHIDKIVVQGEDKLEGLLENITRDKVVVMGSPKADRIYNLENEKEYVLDKLVPSEWKEQIKGKKVFLYNVSINGVLKNSEASISKIKNVLSWFEERDDVLLLWRPHPLLEATYKSMRPDIYQQYMDIKNTFIRSGKGIYDATADIGAAVAIADAYIGEKSSSIIHYFGVAGKPKYFINWDQESEYSNEKGRWMVPANYYVDGDTICFVPQRRDKEHTLFRLDFVDGTMNVEAEMPGKASGNHEWGSYINVLNVNDKLIFPAYNAEATYIYDRETKNAMKIYLAAKGDKSAFNMSFAYKNRVYLKPAFYPALVEINMDNYSVIEYRTCIEQFMRGKENASGVSISFMQENYIYMTSSGDSGILVFDMDSGEHKIINIGEYPFSYWSGAYDGKYFWLSTNSENCIIRWDETTGECKEFSYSQGKGESGVKGQVSIVDNGDSLLLFGGNYEEIIEMDKYTGISKVHNLEKGFAGYDSTYKGKKCGYTFPKRVNAESICLFRYSDCSFVLWNTNTNEQKVFPCRLPYEQLIEMEHENVLIKGSYENIPYAINECNVGIEEFIDYVKYYEYEHKEQEREEYNQCMSGMIGSSGKNIHQYIKGCIKH